MEDIFPTIQASEALRCLKRSRSRFIFKTPLGRCRSMPSHLSVRVICISLALLLNFLEMMDLATSNFDAAYNTSNIAISASCLTLCLWGSRKNPADAKIWSAVYGLVVAWSCVMHAVHTGAWGPRAGMGVALGLLGGSMYYAWEKKVKPWKMSMEGGEEKSQKEWKVAAVFVAAMCMLSVVGMECQGRKADEGCRGLVGILMMVNMVLFVFMWVTILVIRRRRGSVLVVVKGAT